MKQPKIVYVLLLLLSFSISFKYYINANYKKVDSTSSLLYLVPERLRSVIAGILWSKADEYMHFGPSLRETKQTYIAGSYAGNTELIALLSLIIEIVPNQPQAYTVLAQNLSKHFGMFKEGLRVLQYGIIHNKDAEWVNELYAEAAYIYLFDVERSKTNMKIALKYINKAIQKRPTSDDYQPCDFSCTLRNYLMMRSEIKKRLNLKTRNISTPPLKSNKKANIKKHIKGFDNQEACEHDHHHSDKSHFYSYRITLKAHLIYSFLLLIFTIILFANKFSKTKKCLAL